MDDNELFLYHIVPRAQWETQFNGSHYDTADRPETGFIHLCHGHQLAPTVERFYQNHHELLIVQITPTQLPSLKLEDLYGHGEFPHHYGPIPADAIVDQRPWTGANPFGN